MLSIEIFVHHFPYKNGTVPRPPLTVIAFLFLADDIMGTALHDGSRGNQRKLRFLLEFGNRERAAVAHRSPHLAAGLSHILLERSCVRNIRIHAFLKLEFFIPAQILSGPVTRAV